MSNDGIDVVAVALRRLLDLHGHTDVFSGARRIADEPIHPGERALYVGVDVKNRYATSTGRALAREVLRNMGVAAGPMLRTTDGQCAWPAGIVGSIAHDDDVAICAVGVNVAFGIDVEPALPLPAEIKSDVAVSDLERAAVGDDLVAARLLFCAKEAVFKACFPLEQVFFEHADVLLDTPGPLSPSATFQTSTKRIVDVAMTRVPRLLAVARVRLSARASLARAPQPR